MYNDLLSYGDFIQLNNFCNSKELLEEIKDFEWIQYNRRKNINRYGLSVTSSDGTRNGLDLDSLWELSKEHNKIYDEDNFTTLTDVYHKSKEVQTEIPDKNALFKNVSVLWKSIKLKSVMIFYINL